MTSRMQQRRDTAANWTSNNPTLAAGELGLETDTGALKIGTGSTAWTALAYAATGTVTSVTAGTGLSGGTITSSGTVTNSMATAIDAKGDLVAGTADNAFSRIAVGANNTVLTADSTQATGMKWAAAGIQETIVDAKGDLIAATAADAVSRLAVGANNTVLTADSTTTTGLKWAAAAAGGMTLISTTTLSSTSTTISSIPGTYNNLVMLFRNAAHGTTSNFQLRFNNLSTSIYAYNQPNNNPSTTTYLGFDGASPPVASATTAAVINIFDYANTATALCKQVSVSAMYAMNATPSYSLSTVAAGVFISGAITSVTIGTISGVGTISGQVLLYGVK